MRTKADASTRRRAWGGIGRLTPLLALGLLASTPLQAASPAQADLDRGTQLFQAGHYAEAAKAFEAATREDAGQLKGWENLGWAYLRLGRDREAADVWETVLKVEPGHPKLAFQVGEIRLAEGQWDAALGYLEQGLRDPERKPIHGAGAQGLRTALISAGVPVDAARRFEARARRVKGLAPYLREHYGRQADDRGRQAYASEDYRGAAREYETAVRWRPDHVQSWRDLASARQHAGDTRQAAAAWRRATELAPRDERAWLGLAEAQQDLGQTAEARRLYEKVWKMKDGRQPAVAFHLAELTLASGRERAAFDWLDDLMALKDTDGTWGGRIATLLVDSKLDDQGIAFLESHAKQRGSAVVARSALARLYAERGRTAQQAGRTEEARQAYARALEYAPDDGATLRDLGWALWKAGDLDGCEAVWKRYQRIAPKNPQPYDLLAQVSLQHRRYDEAIAGLRTSLRLDRDQPATEVRLVQALYAKGEYKEARNRAQRLALRHPRLLNAQIAWGEILIAYQDYAEARRQWEHVLDLDPDNTRARYYALRALYEQGQQDEAVAEAEADIKAHGPDERILRLLVEDAKARNDTDDAEHGLKELTRRFPDKLDAWLDLARLYRNAGRMRAAWNVLDDAERYHPESLELRSMRLDAMRFVKPERGYKEFRALAEAQPQNRDVFWWRFESALRTGHSEEALDLLRTYGQSRMRPQDYEVEVSRALFAVGKYSEAEHTIRQLILTERGERHVPILLYHGLSTRQRSLAISQAEFESQMKAVRKAGYKALTVSELAQIARGRRKMPARPILITFDDARRDSFDLADPVLRRLGLKATMFVPTSRIHDDGPFFADWATIRKYARTGRWDMQSHGHMAHDPIVVDAAGDRGMFLTNREWRPELERLETFDEYRERIADDYARSVQLLKDNVPGVHVTGFAFPYSEAGQQTIANEPRALEVNREIGDRYFRFGFVQDETGYTRWDGQPSSGMRLLWRLTVPRGWSGQRLLQHLAEEEPVNRAQAEMALLLARMDHIDAARTVWQDAMHEEPLLRARGEYQLALLSSQQGDYRMAERHLQAARAMGVDVRPTMQASVDKIDWESGVRVIPRVRSIRESGDRTTSQQMVEVRAHVGENWDLAARGGQVRYVQGARSAEGYELGGDMVRWIQHLRVEGGATRRWGPRLTDSFQAHGEGRLAMDRFDLEARVGRDDVETFGGRDLGIQVTSVRGGILLRANPRLRFFLQARGSEYDDGVRRRDYLGRVRFAVARSFDLGLQASSQDCQGQSDRYYTPQDLQEVTGLVGYHRYWDFGLRLEAEGGIGAGRDATASRLTGQGRIRAVQELNAHVHGEVSGAYSRSPSYERIDLLANIGVSF